MGAIALRGPADADHYRISVGRFGDRHYTDPLPADGEWEATDAAWPSVTTVKKATGEDWSHVALRRVSRALLKEPRRLDGLDEKDHYATLRMIDENGLSRAGDRGNGVHRYFELRLLGEYAPMLPNDPAWEYRDAIEAFFAEFEPTLFGAELVCIHRTLNGWGYGGTADAILTIRGKHYGVDWKSRAADSQHRALPEEGAQVAGYMGCEYMIVTDSNGRAQRVKPPQLDGGLIVSIKPDGCRVYPVDLGKAFEFWTAMHAFWVARRSQHDGIGRPWAPVPVLPPHEPPAPSHPGAGGSPSRTTATGQPLQLLASGEPPDSARVSAAAGAVAGGEYDAMKERVKRRLAPLFAEHFAELMLSWPAGIPGPTEPGHTLESLALVLDTCRRIEDAHSMPFHEDDAPAPASPTGAGTTSPPQPPQSPDEGERVAALTLEALANEIAALGDTQQAQLAAVVRDAHAHGYGFSLRQRPTVRRFEIARALLFAVAHAWNPENETLEEQLVRAIVAAVTTDPAVEAHSTPLGVAFGRLDMSQARRVANAMQAIGTDSLRVVADGESLHISGSALSAE